MKGGRTATGLGPNVTSIAAPFHELGPSVTLTCSLQFFMVINSLSSLTAILGPVLLSDCTLKLDLKCIRIITLRFESSSCLTFLNFLSYIVEELVVLVNLIMIKVVSSLLISNFSIPDHNLSIIKLLKITIMNLVFKAFPLIQ